MNNKTLFKWFSMLLLMMVAGISDAAAQSLGLADFSIKAGETKDVAITLASESDVYGIQTDIVLSEGLSLEGAPTAVEEGVTFDSNTITSTGATRVALLSIEGKKLATGDVINLKVKAASDFTSGTVKLTSTYITIDQAGTEKKLESDVTASVTLEAVVISSMAIVGDFLGLDTTGATDDPNWNPANGWAMVQDSEKPAIWTLVKENYSAEGKKYLYKATANGKYGDYELPAEGNQDFIFGTEQYPAGTYNLTFTANTAEHTLTLDVQKVLSPLEQAKAALEAAINMAKSLNSADLADAIAAAEAALGNEGATLESLTAALNDLKEAVLPVVSGLLAKAEAFASAFGYSDLATSIQNAKTVVESGDVEAIQTAITALLEQVSTPASEALTKVLEFANELNSTGLTAALSAAQTALQNNDVVGLITALNDIVAEFIPAARTFINDVQTLINNSEGATGLADLQTACTTAQNTLTGSFLKLGAAIKNLVEALKAFREANPTYTVVGNAAFLGETAWAISEVNDMTKGEGGIWTKTYEGVELKNGFKLEYKFVKNGTEWIPQGNNYDYTVWEGDGKYDVTFTYDTGSNQGSCTMTKLPPVLTDFSVTFKTDRGWEKVYAYAWTGETPIEVWPGVEITATLANGVYTYAFQAETAPEKIIFNNGTEAEIKQQTADLDFENGKAYEYNKFTPTLVPGDYYLLNATNGLIIDSNSKLTGEGSRLTFVFDELFGTYTVTGADFFKDQQWTIEGDFTCSISAVFDGVKKYVALDDGNNLVLTTDEADETAQWLPVPAESFESILSYHVAGSASLCGAEWDPTANQMTKNAETGLYEWTAQGITVSNDVKPEFKIAVNNNSDSENIETVAWYPESDASGANNWVINATDETHGFTGEGQYTITITFNAETKAIGVTGERTGDVPEPVPAALYTLKEGDTFTSGETVDVKDGGEVVATITYGEENGADFKAAKADSHVPGYTAFTEGNGTNGDKAGGTFYTIVPKYDGTVSVAVVLNADKKFYIEEEGTALEGYNEMTVAEKYYGTYDFEAKAGKSYKIYCAGSKLGFYGFDYTYTKSDSYTIAGTEDLTGYDWDKTKNEMTLNAESGQYEWKAENITVSDKAQPAFKVVKNAGKDDEAWYPEGDGTTNWVITPAYLGGKGVYTISIAFNATTKEISVSGVKTAEFVYALGDANLDEVVTTSDAVLAVDFALEKSIPTDVQFTAANVNNDDKITVSDAVGIVNIALEIPNGDPTAGARLFDESNNFLTLNGQTLSLTNSTAFAGFQMDVTLAEGAQFNGAQLSQRAAGMELSYNRIGENTWRIIAISLDGNTISGSEGDLLTLDIMGNSTVSVSNIEFADGEANAYALGFGGATGINSVYGVSADSDIYNLNGVRTNTMHKGVNIIRSANGEVKKIFVK